jgi:hypothetical protein
MKAYYARPINLYNTEQDKRDIELIKKLGFELVNPNKEELQNRYKTEGMDVFLQAVSECGVVCFRSFPDMKISAGVKKEVDKGIELGLLIIELPTITDNRILSVDDTRAYLKYLGYR